MSLSLLIVDDSPISRAIIEKSVRMTDAPVGECLHAGNGKEGLDMLANVTVDLMFVDINMPVMNGVELVEQMNQLGLIKTIPVIVISTEGSQKRIDHLHHLGVRGYLRKPFTPEDLQQTIHTALEQSHVA